MPPKGAPTRIKPLHLQTIQKLRVKSPNTHQANPCLAAMTSVLSCWASNRSATSGCFALEQQLRTCMDNGKPQRKGKSTINYHLMRMFPKISGPRKKDGVFH
ncbi:mitochondrial 37S ribosomal protein YmS-T [Histoplasma ohiense]|nr:mitochondrial 37S ribosomal protein YmS-T [Histoplasma ohiense (nom. inval.)]